MVGGDRKLLQMLLPVKLVSTGLWVNLRKNARLFCVAGLLALLAGCQSFSPSTPESHAVVTDYKYLEIITSDTRPAATAQLLKDAREKFTASQYDESLQDLGRALRISPDDGLVYFYMALVRYRTGDYREAVSLTRRGLFFASQPMLRKELSALLKDAEAFHGQP